MWAERIGCSMVVVSGLWLAQQSALSRAVTANAGTERPGDAARGQAIFEGKGGCLACHRVADEGSLMGPDLSTIATDRTVEQLRKALLDPAPAVEPGNQLYRVVASDGTIVTGRILNQDRFSLQLLTREGRLRSFQKSNLRTYGFIKTAAMPSYRDRLTAEEQIDLVAFLASLK